MGQQPESKLRSSGLYLLLSLILLVLLSPLLEGSVFATFALTALYSLVMLTVVYAVSPNRQARTIAMVWALAGITLLWWNRDDPADISQITGLSAFVALNTAAIVLVFRRIFQSAAVTFDTLCHAVGLYLLLGVTWALTYLLISLIVAGAFVGLAAGLDSGWSDFLYFSFATLTTLGYGDITPDLPFVRIWAVMEAVVGVLYIAILVARLVSLYRG